MPPPESFRTPFWKLCQTHFREEIVSDTFFRRHAARTAPTRDGASASNTASVRSAVACQL